MGALSTYRCTRRCIVFAASFEFGERGLLRSQFRIAGLRSNAQGVFAATRVSRGAVLGFADVGSVDAVDSCFGFLPGARGGVGDKAAHRSARGAHTFVTHGSYCQCRSARNQFSDISHVVLKVGGAVGGVPVLLCTAHHPWTFTAVGIEAITRPRRTFVTARLSVSAEMVVRRFYLVAHSQNAERVSVYCVDFLGRMGGTDVPSSHHHDRTGFDLCVVFLFADVGDRAPTTRGDEGQSCSA